MVKEYTVNTVQGKIILSSGIGIPDLVVTIYDLDPHTQPEEVFGTSDVENPPVTNANIGDRLGSVLTDTNGKFELSYDDTSFRIQNPQEKRPDLFLVVSAPESRDIGRHGGILHVSAAIRQQAGHIESYVIRLTNEQLEKAGVSLPAIPTDEFEEPIRVVERLEKADLRRQALAEGWFCQFVALATSATVVPISTARGACVGAR
jgi:hypothetical protein